MNEFFRVAHRLEIDAEALGPREQQTEFFVEDEQGAALAARDGGSQKVQRKQRFAGAGGTDDQVLDPAEVPPPRS